MATEIKEGHHVLETQAESPGSAKAITFLGICYSSTPLLAPK